MKKNKRLTRLEQLKTVYALFESQLTGYHLICKEKCAACCTCNVTLTSLEATYMIQTLSDDQKQVLLKKIENNFPLKRYIPKMTTNQFARFCREGQKIPEEENDPLWGQCCLLENSLCSQYENRPFGCRALLSSIDCKKHGYAQVSPFLLTLNNLFLQYIEHMDQDGFSGNLADMLIVSLSGKALKFKSDPIKGTKDDGFVRNEKISILMVPQEHQKQIQSVIVKLNGILEL
ncbi:MAG: hypothetical protein ABIJ59_20205 [Pseudomonadota bacterium]